VSTSELQFREVGCCWIWPSAEPAPHARNLFTCANSIAWTHVPQAVIFGIPTSSVIFGVPAVGLLRNPGGGGEPEITPASGVSVAAPTVEA
jgi:hypothetical protein